MQLENFQVLDDGKERAISTTREGQARTLALVIILDCREDGAGRFLRRPEILKAMADELAKLPQEDEVAIMAMNIGEDEKRVWLSDFTHDPAQLAAALARVPAFVENPDRAPDDRSAEEKQKQKEKQAAKQNAQNEQKGKGSLTINADTNAKPPEATDAKATQEKPKGKEIVETETIKGKNGR